jgi:hypothetical protein
MHQKFKIFCKDSFSKTSTTRIALVHLIISTLLAIFVAILVFTLWFPENLHEIAGGQRIFWLIIGVDLICGPLLTLLLIKKSKSRLAISVDLFFIATIQLAAMAYGLNSLATARPIALVFEVDRFRLISYADVPESDLDKLPSWAKPWSFDSLRTVGLRVSASASERLKSLEMALQGVDAGQLPSRWQDYNKNKEDILKKAKPISVLRAAHPENKIIIDKSVATALANMQYGESKNGSDLLWLPMVSRNALDWVVLLDPNTLRIRAYVPVDGFL